ncbi:DNA-binding transcriptional LysR family regulator [Arthrobacter sp. CAN_A214]|uniref:LysR family transcriptional regulator substrate-binding protein n=1 Tax=Arthrobacter sp. CAN_A214 TaxID=2787720 RepID=UPI0018C93797
MPVLPVLQPRSLSVGFVAGVTPGKWVARWRERHPGVDLELHPYDDDAALPALKDAGIDVLFVRLPIERQGLHVIPLYEEQAVVVMSRENELSLYEEVALTELHAENRLGIEECGGPKAAVEVAASGAGVVVLPMSLARLHMRKDAVHRPVPELPGTVIGIAWRKGDESPDVEEFIGIVRGRTERSSRQPSAQEPAEAKRSASQKAAAKKAGSQGAGGKGAGGKHSGAKPVQGKSKKASPPRRGRRR